MANFTTNYNLKKPLANENYNIDDQNGNMDIIDVTLAGKETPIGAQSKADAALVAGKAYADQGIAGKISHSLATAANDFLVASGVGTFVKKTLAEVKSILGLGSAAYTNSNAYATAAQGTTADTTAATVTTHLADIAVQVPQAGSTANALVLNIIPTANMPYKVKAAAENTGNMTINAKPFLNLDGSQLAAGKIKSGKVYDFYYDAGSGGRFFLLARASGTAVVADVLAGKTFSNDNDTDIVGTMPDYTNSNNVGVVGVSTSAAGQIAVVPYTGAYNQGASRIQVFLPAWDANFVGSNFPADKIIFGAQGSIPIISPDYSNQIPALNFASGPYSGDGQNYIYSVFKEDGVRKICETAAVVRQAAPTHLPQNIKKGITDLGVTGTLIPHLKVDDFATSFSFGGVEIKCIDDDYIYLSVRGDYSPNVMKYNHAGTLVSSFTASGINGYYYGGTYSKYGVSFFHPSSTANVRIYDPAGTLIYNFNPYQATNSVGNSGGFNGELFVYHVNSASPYMLYLYTPSGTFLGYSDATTVGPGSNGVWWLNAKETLVWWNMTDGNALSPGYITKGSNVVRPMPTGLFPNIRAAFLINV